jgi:dihydroorotase
MKTIKIIDAICATSTGVGRRQISFDEKSGLITSVDENKFSRDQIDYYYADDCLLFAGMGDIHIHAREDVSGKNTYKEDFRSVCKAAINGGLVHVADMPNNPVPPIDDKSYLEKMALTKKSEVPILLYAGIGPETRPLSFSVPYKVYMGPSIGDLFFKNNTDLDSVLVHYRGQCVSFHCEDPEILEKHKGEKDHFTKRPVVAELMATDFALSLIEKYGLKGKLCHYSAGEGLESIRRARQNGVNVTCEVTPQHLFFSEEKIRAMDKAEQVHFQMNPPIRSESDAQLLLAALKRGEIDYLATDHAPHSHEEKNAGMSGLPGLDTFGPFVTWLMADCGIKAETIALIASENPGRFFNSFLSSLNEKSDLMAKWGRGMGFLEKDYSASFTVINLKKPITISREQLKTKAAWSPFLGVTFPGSVETLILAGKVVTENN